MVELLRSNDTVLLSFVEVLLRDSGVTAIIADRNMSIMEGSIGVLSARVLVNESDVTRARQLLRDAELGAWLKDDG